MAGIGKETVMKVALFGGNGRTGRELLLQLLVRGQEVTAIVRKPSDFHIDYDRLTIVLDGALEPDSFGDSQADKDAVLFVLDVTGSSTRSAP